MGTFITEDKRNGAVVFYEVIKKKGKYQDSKEKKARAEIQATFTGVKRNRKSCDENIRKQLENIN